MIEVEKDNKFKECLSCHSSKDVLLISLGSKHRMHSFKICAKCIDELIKKVEE